MGLPHFDGLILISYSRFTENDGKLVQKIDSMESPVPLFLVRSKFDIDMKNDAHDQNLDWQNMTPDEKEEFRDQTEKIIKESAKRELGDVYKIIQNDFYVLSNHEPALSIADWQRFHQRFMTRLADNRGCDHEQLSKIEQMYQELHNQWQKIKTKIFGFGVTDPGEPAKPKDNQWNDNSYKNWTVEETADFVLKQTDNDKCYEAILVNKIDGKTFGQLEKADGQDLGLGSIDMNRMLGAIDVAKTKHP